MGGNLAVQGFQAQHLDLNKTPRGQLVSVLNKLFYAIDGKFNKLFGSPLWNGDLLRSQEFLSGSSLQFFNIKKIPDEIFTRHKPSVGDIDTMVAREKETELSELLTRYTNKKIGPAILRGFQRGNEQFSSLWELQSSGIVVQIDFEFVEFDNEFPTDWARFSHSSAWPDIQAGIKGVFHKWLIQSLTALSRQEFYQRKLVGRGKARAEQDILTTDNLYSFAVSSKESGGLRAKYQTIVDPATDRPIVKDGLPVMRALPTTGYEQNLAKIFSGIFGNRLSTEQAASYNDKFWSFTGLVDLIQSLLSNSEKQLVVDAFLKKTIGEGSQGLYKNDPDKDMREKLTAIKYLLTKLGIPVPSNFRQMLSGYRSGYKMTPDNDSEADTSSQSSIVKDMAKNALKEASAYGRKSVPHLYNPGSSAEIKDQEFIALCEEILTMGGKLNQASINLKVDGAGISFGKDTNGKPFFMTSRVTDPKYIENYGDFTRYGQTKGQDQQQLDRASKYDQALRIILTSDFIKQLPSDTIVRCEMLFVPMSTKTATGLKFVNIEYDPSKLGSVMTLVPFEIKQFSTGQARKDSAKIKGELINSSSPKIKIMDNRLAHNGVNVLDIVSPIVEKKTSLIAALKSRQDPESKTKAKQVLASAKQKLSDRIANDKSLSGKDKLGNTMEGIILNFPSGRIVKITSPEMKSAMRTKISEATSKRFKPAVVTVGSFVGHKGHQQLINQVIATAKLLGGDAYVYVSPTVGPDDPVPPEIKLATLKTLFPAIKNNIQVWQEGGNALKKIEKELVLPSNSPYNKIILMVGDDRYEGFNNWMKSLEKRMHDPRAVAKFGGTQNQVEFETRRTERDLNSGGTGISFTMLRNVLNNDKLSENDKLVKWLQSFDTDTLGIEWVKKLMAITNKRNQLASIKEYINKIKPMLGEASPQQRMKFAKILEDAKKQLEKDEAKKDKSDLSAVERAYFDPETHAIMSYARQHYPEEPDLQSAFIKFVLRSLKHSKEDDERQNSELDDLETITDQHAKDIDLLFNMFNSLSDKTDNTPSHKHTIDESADYLSEK